MLNPTARNAACVLSFVLLGASAQTSAAPSFEVASIRPHVAAATQAVNGKMIANGGMRMVLSGSRAIVTGATLASLIGFAYDLKPFELGEKGGPGWESQQFDISAKAGGDGKLTRDQFRPLFQALLRDRFQLKFHRETKQTSGYMLTPGSNGARIKAASPDEPSNMSISSPASYAEMTVFNWTMAQLTRQLTLQLGQPVLDNTGLTGGYDYKLTWSDNNPEYATIFTALQEQLGLKLEPHKGPLQLLVIDSATRPSLD